MTAPNLTDYFRPPSVVLKELFHTSIGSISEEFIENAALLPPTETRFWLEHLQTIVDNRRRGAAKAAATRKAKKKAASTEATKQVPPGNESTASYFCATCGIVYMEEAEQEEAWIGCDLCNASYHTD
jgi:hypothetical protein